MKPLPTLLIAYIIASAFTGCSDKKSATQENSIDNLVSFSSKSISEKRWCYESYIFYLKNDQTCFVTRIEDEKLDWGSAQWALTHDTLLIIQKDEKLLQDTAFYKIMRVTENLLAIKLVKDLRDNYHKSRLVPFGRPDDPYKEATFWLDKDHPSIEDQYVTGSWHGDGRINEFDFNKDGVCYAYGEASQMIDAKQRKGTWKLQDNFILLNWNELRQPVIKENDNGEKYSPQGEYDTLQIMEYDTLHIVRSTTFRLITRESGLLIGGSNKEFLKSIGY